MTKTNIRACDAIHGRPGAPCAIHRVLAHAERWQRPLTSPASDSTPDACIQANEALEVTPSNVNVCLLKQRSIDAE